MLYAGDTDDSASGERTCAMRSRVEAVPDQLEDQSPGVDVLGEALLTGVWGW